MIFCQRPASKGGMDHVTWSYYALSVLWMLIWLPECNAGNHTEYKHPDVEAERNNARIIGVCVGVGLAMMFLVMLCISYNYYKHKTVPIVEETVVEAELPKKKVFASNDRVMQIHTVQKKEENITQDTRF